MRPKAWKMDWELRRGSEVAATLASPSLFGTTARASLGTERYVSRKGGVRRPGASIAMVGKAGELATLEFAALDHGTLVLTDGTTYLWRKSDPAGTWLVSREDGTTLFTIHRDLGGKSLTGKVEVLATDRYNGILLILLWFTISNTDC